MSASEQFLYHGEFAGDQLEEDLRRPVRMAATVFPVEQRAPCDANAPSEFGLGQTRTSANFRDIDSRYRNFADTRVRFPPLDRAPATSTLA